MDVHLAQELLNELGSSLENLEAQQSALLQLLKDKGLITDEQLAPYLNQASNASNVRWRAARLRLERIFSTAAEQQERPTTPQEKRPNSESTAPEQQRAATREAKDSDYQDEDRKAKRDDQEKATTEHGGRFVEK